jgi:hypothetical protein
VSGIINEANKPPPSVDELDEEPYFRSLTIGSEDKLLGVKVKSILHKAQDFIVYLDTQTNLQWADIFEQDPDFFATVLTGLAI